jgi:hypothetical protein
MLGGRDQVHPEMHLEAKINRVWICIWRLRSSELRDALGSCNRVSVQMHLAMIDRQCRSTRRQSMEVTLGAETIFISW